jgi:inosine-uridine nucleoside N-ribohydrolase
VSGEPVPRAKLASALCVAAGKNDLPILPGADRPLLSRQLQPKAPQTAALARWPHASSFPEGQALEFMRRTIRANPGEVTLLAIGPMTNVALLFAADPAIPGLLKQLVLMCGVFTNRLAGVGPLEWNAICDPHASAIVYRAAAAAHRSIGLDVTCCVNMTAPEVRARFQAPLLQPVSDFAEVWFQHRPTITFHDPLAAATIFDPQLCSFAHGTVEVELASERLGGLTYWTPGGDDAPHAVALEVDAPRFFEHYFSVFGGTP